MSLFSFRPVALIWLLAVPGFVVAQSEASKLENAPFISVRRQNGNVFASNKLEIGRAHV